MNKTIDILFKISKGKTMGALSRELGMRKSTVQAMIDSMIHIGYIEEIRCKTGCGICPIKCANPQFPAGIRMYALTDKGMVYIKVHKWRFKYV